MRLFLCAAFLPALLYGQSDLASLQGKVIDSATGQGVRKATVTLRCNSNSNGGTYTALTNPSGEFRFDSLQPASCMASAEAEGYNFPPGGVVKMFPVASGEQKSGIEISLAPFGVITGKVVDENGEPVVQVSVMAMTYVYNNLHRTLQQIGSGGTDDRGIYRIFDVPAGRYYLAVNAQLLPTPSPHVHSLLPEEGYARVFYPGVADVTQTSLHTLKAGEQWTGADFKLRKQHTYHIRGRVDPSSQVMRAGGPMVEYAQCNGDTMMGANTQNAIAGQDGSFDIPGLVPGNYCLMLRDPMRGAIALRQLVTVKDADIEGIKLAPPAPFSIKGSVTFDGAPPVDRNFHLSVLLNSDDGFQQSHAEVAPDLSFQLENVFPGKYTLTLPQWLQFYAKSILYGSQDVSNGMIPDAEPGASLTIVLGSDPGEIDGTIQSGSPDSAAPVTIALMPDDAHIGRADLYRIYGNTTGRFSIQGLGPGDYRVFALDGPNNEDAHNPDLLKSLESRATLATVHPNGHEQISLSPIPASEIEAAKDKLQ
jgi:hypothetical protein